MGSIPVIITIHGLPVRSTCFLYPVAIIYELRLCLFPRLKVRLRQKMERQVKTVMQHLNEYDQVFSQLTRNGNATAFRDFLLRSPDMFLSLGDGCGLVSHIAAYWRYQFPKGKPLLAPAVDLKDVLQEFEISLGSESELQPA